MNLNYREKEMDLSNLSEGELAEIMEMPLVQLEFLAKGHDEFVRVVRLAINKGIELGRQATVLAWNKSLRGRTN